MAFDGKAIQRKCDELGATPRPVSDKLPPITTYVVRPEKMGERVVATEEYREWHCRTYGVVRDEVAQPEARTSKPDPIPGNKGGAKAGDLKRFQPT